MNKFKNIDIVEKHGDKIQLEFGAEFGFFAKQLSRKHITSFCDQFNIEPWVSLNGYYLTSKYNSNDYTITLTKGSILRVTVKLLDHSIYIDATEQDWMNIEKNLFMLLQKSWRNYLSNHIKEYGDHLRNTFILANLDPAYSA